MIAPPIPAGQAAGLAPGRPWQRAVLVAVPLALLAAWLSLLAAKGPYWLGTSSDPDYQYLLNGLGLAHGHVPGHVDHPGTPVQELMAVLLPVTHLLAGEGSLADDVIRRPEEYLLAANGVLLVLFAAALAVAGLAALRATGSLLAALAAQVLPGLAPVVAVHVVCVKPEPLLATLATLLGAQALATLAPDRPPGRRADASVFGILVGLALATKVSSAPLALLPLPILKGRAARLRYAGVAAGTAALATLPAWPAMSILRDFILRIATHSGQYGGGKASVLDLREYAAGLRTLATSEVSGRMTLALLGLGALVALALAWRARRGAAPRAAAARDALAAAVVMQAASFLFVARHAYIHYLLPAIVVSGLTAALGVHGVRCLLPDRAAIRLAATAVLACLLAAGGLRLARELRAQRASLQGQRDAQLALAAAVAGRYPDARVIHFYRSSSPAFALHFGDMYNEGRWWSRIQRLYPRHLYYNRWAEQLEGYHPDPAHPEVRPLEWRPLTLEDLCGPGGADPALVQGPLLPDVAPSPAVSGSQLRSRLELIQAWGDEALYRPRECPAAAGEGAR